MWKPRQRQRPQVHYQSRSGHEYLCTLLTPLLPGQILLYNRKNIYKWFGMNMWTCVYISRWGRTTSQIKIPVPADSEFETTEFLASKSCYTKFIIMTSSCLYLPYLGGQAFTKVNDPIVGQPKNPSNQPTNLPSTISETQNCQSCGHAPVFFFCRVVAWQMAFIFVFSNWQQLL